MKTAPTFIFVVVFAGLFSMTTLPVFAQTSAENCTSIYQVLVDNRKSEDIQKLKLAFNSGNDYLAKCKDVADQEAHRGFVERQIPVIQREIKKKEIEILAKRYATASKAKNYDEMVLTAKELLKEDRPYALDLMLDLATIGLNNASSKQANNKYNDDAISYAKQSLQKISEGKISETYGSHIVYKTAKCPDGKANATGWMNFTIGYITYVSMGQTNDAIPYLYKASQTGCGTRSDPQIFELIGAWYSDEVVKLNASRAEKIKAAGDQDTEETLAILALQKGYAERSFGAYSHAYSAAKSNANVSQVYKDELLGKLRSLYEIRFGSDLSKFDAYLA